MATDRVRELAGVGWLLVLASCGRGEPVAQPDGTEGAVWFEECSEASGLAFIHRSGHQDERFLFPEIMGGGAALFDKDDDGDLDAYLVQSGSILGDPGAGNRLFENGGEGRFEDVSAASGADDRGYGMGVAAGDCDGDGDTDLYVTNLGANALLCNLDGTRFRAAPDAGAGDPSWGTSVAFLDDDADGDLDLFVVNYVRWSVADELECSSVPHGADYCSPLSYDNPAPDVLLRNDGRGGFRDVSAQAGLRSAFGNGLGIACADFDADGGIDVFVANDGMVNQLWINQRDGTFVDRAALSGCAVDQNGLTKAGMGTHAIDVDDDGDEDLLVVNLAGESDSFYRNDGAFFSDRTPLVGLAVPSRPFTRFGCGLADFDNDGRLDLYLANGRVTKAAEPGEHGFFDEPNLLFRGVAGPRLEEVSPRGGTLPQLVATSRAAAFGDVDGDGGVDVLVVNRDARAYLLRDVVAGGGHWIRFSVRERSGAHALGAVLRMRVGERVVTRRVTSAYSYQSANDPRVHVGLGPAERVEDVSVRWADGSRQDFGPFDVDQDVELRRDGAR